MVCEGVKVRRSLRSAPAQKVVVGWEEARIMAWELGGEVRRVVRVVESAVRRARERALRVLGELRRRRWMCEGGRSGGGVWFWGCVGIK